MRPFWIGLIVAVLILMVHQSAAAAPPAELDLGGASPWQIEAERMDFDEEGRIVEAHGHVVIKHNSDRLTAEHVRLDRRNNNLEAWEQVVWHHGADVLRAERVKLNLDTEMGKAFGGRLFFSGNHFHVSGREIDKTGEKTYIVRDCTITTCDGSKPDWLIRASWMRVTVEGYAHLLLPRFHIGPIPTLGLPYAFFPAKTKRQSGFLMPSFSQSSRDGFTFELPFYWAWADWGDTTFHLHHSERGEGLGAELRFKLGHEQDVGLFYFDYLNDQKAEEFYAAGEIASPDSERYWVRGMFRANQLLPWKTRMNLIIDKPSDPDIIREFQYWSTGLDKINPDFERLFGTALRDETEAERINSLQLKKWWPWANATVEFRYYEDTTPLPPGQFDETFHSLPRFQFSFNDRAIATSDFYYNLRLGGQNWFREHGERGQSLNSQAEMYALLDAGPYIRLQPSVQAIGDWWFVDPNPESGEEAPEGFDHYRDRYYWQTGMDASTTLFRIFEVDGVEWKKIKHQIVPQIGFSYVPYHYEPSSSAINSPVAEQELINYRLTTTLTAKKAGGQKEILDLENEIWRRRYLGGLARWGFGRREYAGWSDEDLEGEYQRRLRLSRLQSPPSFSYDEFLRLEVGQSFDLREVRLDKPEGVPRRPFSTVQGDLWFQPSYYLSHRTTVEYDQYAGKVPRLALRLDLRDRRGDNLGFYFRRRWNTDYETLEVSQFRAQAGVKLFGPWSTSGEVIYDFEKEKSITHSLRLYYQRQCWGVALLYTKDEFEERYGVVFSLFGLGEVYSLTQSSPVEAN